MRHLTVFMNTFLLCFCLILQSEAKQQTRDIPDQEPSLLPPLALRVSEDAPLGHIVGYVEGHPITSTESRFFVVSTDADGAESSPIKVNERTGEISVTGPLDYETKKRYELVAIPINGGGGIPIAVDIEDENDNEPVFTQPDVQLEISEFVRIGAEFPLPSAIDRDGPPLDVRSYRIIQGNVNNVFKLSTKRINNVLYADLVVNGRLDREYRESYDLIVEAIDGGSPPKIGELHVSVLILDANDNAPEFTEKIYHANIDSNHPMDKPILQVRAIDRDSGHNGQVGYRLGQSTSPAARLFSLSPSGVLTRRNVMPLPSATFEFVVIAADHGMPPQESSAVISVSVNGGSSSMGPTLDILWLTQKANSRILENVTLGSIVARVNVTNYDQMIHGSLELTGCPSLCLQQSQHPSVHLIILCGILDREMTAEYHLKFILKKEKDIILEHPLVLTVEDVNDNSPIWPQKSYHLTLNRTMTNPDDPHLDLSATDADAGKNGRLNYWIEGTDVIQIDEYTGRLRYSHELNCSLGSEIRFRVHASDAGTPSLTSHVQAIADIVDSSGKPPQFDRPLYTETIKEDTEVGTCILKVSAQTRSCASSKRVRYALKQSKVTDKDKLSIDPVTGAVCLKKSVDFETETSINAVIEATDYLGISSSTVVNIDINDVNDNAPIFYPESYNITIRESEDTRVLLNVHATDKDSGLGGQVKYALASGEAHLINVDPSTGAISTREPLKRGEYTFHITASDALGLTAKTMATVQITVIAESAKTPIFSQAKYELHTSEDILPGISIGSVEAYGGDDIRYSIYGGDPEHQFTINPETGKITVARYLDADKQDEILLNIKADLPGGLSNHTQVLIYIEDHNDNSPEFAEPLIEITVREDAKPQQTFFIVQATDKDKRKNGELSYSLVSSSPTAPVLVQPITGHLVLTAPLDYERIREYRLKIKAQDHGIPPRAANVTVIVHVSDVNDNSPVFTEKLYDAQVVEHSAAKTTIVQVRANDADSDDNGRVEYRLDENVKEFGIDSRTGEIFTKMDIDREFKAEYNLTVYAFDGGSASRMGTSTVSIKVLDINDHSPECIDKSPISVNVQADTRRAIGTVMAVDKDAGENGTLFYRSQQTHPNFIVKANGDVFLRGPLMNPVSGNTDQRLSVIVSDGGIPSRSTVCHYTIRILEGKSKIELKKPVEEVIRIGANCTNGCKLIQINATNVAIYQLQSSEFSSFFSISTLGMLFLEIVPPTKQPFRLSVILSDDLGRQVHVSFRIIPYRDYQAERIVVPVSAETKIGSQISMLPHQNNSVFHIPLNLTDFVELDESSGALYLTSTASTFAGQVIDLFFEEGSLEHSFTNMKIVSLEVEPIAQQPHFSQALYNVILSEATIPGTVVFTPSLKNTIPNASFRLIEGDEFFILDTLKGEVSLTRTLDWSEHPMLFAVIQVENEGFSENAAVQFEIEDTNNHAPEFLSSSEITLTHPIPRPLHYIVASDKDSGDNGNLNYSMVSGDVDYFLLDKSSGALVVIQNLDGEKKLIVRCTDNGNPPKFTDQEISFKIMQQAKRWAFFAAPHMEIVLSEDADIGTTLLNLTAAAENVKLTLLPQNSPFSYDKKNNKIIVSSKLILTDYLLTVFAENESFENDFMTMSVKIKSHSTNFIKISSASCGSISVHENHAVPFLKPIIASYSEGANVSFQIQAGNEGNLFALDSTTGWLSCKELDRETKSNYLLVITAQQGRKSDTCTVRVTVLDENDNAPKFTVSDSDAQLRIDDVTKIGDALTTISAKDADSSKNGQIFFSIVEDPSNLLDIDSETGIIFYAREQPVTSQTIQVRVRATDQSIYKPLSTDLTIMLKDFRTHYEDPSEVPEFTRSHYIGSIAEGESRNTKVLTLDTTSSRDARLAYSIVDGNYDAAFHVDHSGNIRTSLELDREIRANYDLVVIATGKFSEKVITNVSITVLNVNDNAPSFPSIRKRKLSEVTSLNSFITTITANDVDEDSEIEYSIDKEITEPLDSKQKSHFVIDSRSGAIHLVRALDREQFTEIKLIIKAFDGVFYSFAELVIEVLDENDNAPIFSQPFYQISIPNTISSGDAIGVIHATDADNAPNKVALSYTIEEANSSFKINSQTGVISLMDGVVLSNMSSTHLFSVIASDNGLPNRSSAVAVHISTQHSSSTSKTRFSNDFYNFSVIETLLPNLHIGQLTIQNSVMQTATHHFRILNETAAHFFELDGLGHIWLKKSLLNRKIEKFEFKVDVFSGWSPEGNATAFVCINVIDINDHAPLFQIGGNTEIKLAENLADKSVLLRLTAIDDDFNENGRVTIRTIAGDTQNCIKMDNSAQSLIWSASRFCENAIANRSVVVLAADNGINQKVSLLEVPVSADVSKWSAAAPFFVLPQYTRYIKENIDHRTPITRISAINKIGIPFGEIKYSLKDQDALFAIDATNGDISSLEPLDYEKQRSHTMSVNVADSQGRSAIVPLKIVVLPVDEFPPLFPKPSYTFSISAQAPTGTEVGQVTAVDSDAGIDGIVRYRFEEKIGQRENVYFGIDPISGLIRSRTKMEASKNGSIETLTVIAESSSLQQSQATIYIEIGGTETIPRPREKLGSVWLWTISGLIGIVFASLLCILIACVYRHKSKVKEVDSPKKQVYAVSRGQVAVMASMQRDSPPKTRFVQKPPIVNKSCSMSSHNSEPIPVAPTRTSGVSSREFLATRSQPDSGIDQDTISVTSSVTEYLQSLGVSTSMQPKIGPHKHITGKRDSDSNSLIYARLEDILGPGAIQMAHPQSLIRQPIEVPILRPDSPPSFQPLTEIFAEIERMQQEDDHRIRHPTSSASSARFVDI